jgi:hypothetical protein
MYLYIVLVALVLYLIISYVDEQRNLKQHKPPSGVATKVVFGFFSFILAAGGYYMIGPLLGGGGEEVLGGSGLVTENAHLKNIIEEVEVGLPKF